VVERLQVFRHVGFFCLWREETFVTKEEGLPAGTVRVDQRVNSPHTRKGIKMKRFLALALIAALGVFTVGWDSMTVALMVPLALIGVVLSSAAEKETNSVPRPLSFTMKSLSGKDVDLGKYQGKVVLIVNVASKCVLTPQYEQLQALHEKYSKNGLAILGFPCNQFLYQERGTAEQIQEFCRVNYGVSFDMFSKIEVNGDGACQLYKYLTSLNTKWVGSGKIGWNFEKFIIGRNGEVVARFSPKTKPDDAKVLKVLEAELAKAKR